MTSRQANQAIKEAAKEDRSTYYWNPEGQYGVRVYRVRVKAGVAQAMELNSGKWADLASFSDLYHQ